MACEMEFAAFLLASQQLAYAEGQLANTNAAIANYNGQIAALIANRDAALILKTQQEADVATKTILRNEAQAVYQQCINQ